MPTSVRRRLATASILLLVPALGACGFDEQTDQVYQPAVGVNDRTGAVDVLGAVVVSGTEGEGVFVTSLVNNDLAKSEQLSAISGDGVEVTLDQPVEVKPDTLVNLADKGGVNVTGDRVDEGSFVRLTLEFSSGQKTELNVPVVRRDGAYATITPGPSPSESSSPSKSPSSTESPSSPTSVTNESSSP